MEFTQIDRQCIIWG